MKYKGGNIITDQDITLTGKYAGENLSDILDEQNEKLNKANSNIKFLYQHGGIGGGAGNGSGGSEKAFSIVASIERTALSNGKTVILENGEGVYRVSVSVSYPQGRTFTIEGSYGYKDNGKVKTRTIPKKTVSLELTGGYSYDFDVTLNCNESITIKVTDNFVNEIKTITCNYVVTPFTFASDVVALPSGKSYSSTDYQVLAKEVTLSGNGLATRLKYNISVDINTIQYRYYLDGVCMTEEGTWEEVDVSKNPNGFIEKQFSNEFINSRDSAGLHSGYYHVKVSTNGQDIEQDYSFSFNYIPDGLFLMVTPQRGEIYMNNTGLEKYYEHVPGNFTFYLKIFNDDSTSGIYNVYYRVNDDNYSGTILQDMTSAVCSVTSYKTGWNTLSFKIGDDDSTLTQYYYYIKDLNVAFDYYDEEISSVSVENYYRGNSWSKAFNENEMFQKYAAGKSSVGEIMLTPNSTPLTISNLELLDTKTINYYDTHIAIGIQYSSTNNDNDTILTAKNNGTTVFTMTQNQINIDMTSIDFYVPKTESYGKTQLGEYHLIDIYQRCIKKGSDVSSYYYEFVVYLDGELESGLQGLRTSNLKITDLVFNNINIILNQIEVTYIPQNTFYDIENDKWRNPTTNYTNNLESVMNQYYLRYRNHRLTQEITTKEKTMLEIFKNIQYTRDGRAIVESGDIARIAENADVPVLLFTADEDKGQLTSGLGIMNYLEQSFGEEDDINSIRVLVSYCTPGHSLENISTDNVIENPDDKIYFEIAIQGSSTRGYKSKNFELSVVNTNSDNSGNYYVFSPNFKNGDTTTFLPEESFTLKADVVDSSHSNNTSMGKFINANTSKFNTGDNSYYKNYIKNCLDGFPVLVFMTIATDSETSTSYFMGIYNFNLGRKSYFNLGYRSAEAFENENNQGILADANDGFTFACVSKTDLSEKDDLLICEVQGNSDYFDFSQYNKSILFPLPNLTGDKTYMFGDIVTGSSHRDNYQNRITAIVKQIALSGGYLFQNVLQKNLGAQTDGYSAYDTVSDEGINQVPDYTKQYERKFRNGNNVYELINETRTENNTTYEKGREGTLTDLNTLLGISTGEETITPMLNYKSLSEYYLICMAGGLVDSVQKNLNLKKWGETWYLAFYDMDTCLGIDNQGRDISYFAFSDYWKSVETTDVVNGETVVTPQSIKVFRDFFPSGGVMTKSGKEEHGFDCPSSYLFAIAKYAHLATDDSGILYNYPQMLWNQWRNSVQVEGSSMGCLQNADYFMNTYFGKTIQQCGKLCTSLNYRVKYFINYASDTAWNNTNFEKFKGNKLYKTRDWLNGRIHILDEYFNMNAKSRNIQRYNLETKEWEETDLSEALIRGAIGTSNSDVLICHDIFTAPEASESGFQTAKPISIDVKAPEYTPMCIFTPNDSSDYLIGGDEYYHLYVKPNGDQRITFGGSAAWTYLSSINDINQQTIQIYSDKLGNITGTSGTVNGFKFDVPAVREITLTSPNYSGSLSLVGEDTNGSHFMNLTTIDISGSKIQLNIKDLHISELNVSNVSTTNISVVNCQDLRDINLSGLKVSETCTLTPIPGGIANVVIAGTEILNLYVSADAAGQTLKITSDKILKKVQAIGFNKVEISDCPNLEEIILTDSETADKVETLKIVRCSTGKNCAGLKIHNGMGNTSDNVYNYIDLSGYSNLKSVSFNGTTKIVSVILPTNTEINGCHIEKEAFNNCQALKNLSINGDGKIYIDNGYKVFYNCKEYYIKEDGKELTDIRLWVTDKCTTMEQMFYLASSDATGHLRNREILEYFIEHCIDPDNQITNLSQAFYHNNYEYNESNLASDMAGSHQYIDMSVFKHVDNVTQCFFTNTITAWNQEMFNFGTEHDAETISMDGYLSSSTVKNIYTTVKVLRYCITKATTLFNSMNNGDAACFHFMVYNSATHLLTPATDVKLYDFFHPNLPGSSVTQHPVNVKSLTNFGLAPISGEYDFSNIFDEGWDSLTEVKNFLYSSNHYDASSYKNLDGLFKNITTLTNVRQLLSLTKNEPVSLYNFFNWDSILAHKDCCFLDKYDEHEFILNKQITDNNFRALLTKLANDDCLWTKMSYLFKNCTLQQSSPNLITSAIPVNTKIVEMESAFHNFKIEDMYGDEICVNINNIFEYFPNVKRLHCTFSGMRLANTLPYNFFNKREEVISNVTYDDNGVTKNGKLVTYTYRQEIEEMGNCFENCVWTNGEGARYTSYPTLEDAHLLDESDNVIERTYDGNEYYYDKRGNQVSLENLTEISDAAEALAIGGYSNYPLDNVSLYPINETFSDKEVGQYPMYSNWALSDNEEASKNLILPADIFYGCTNSANLALSFANNITEKTDGVFNEDCGRCLEGLLPKHLFKTILTGSVTSFLKNHNVIPYKVGDIARGSKTEHIYAYVPEAFVSTTKLNLRNMFNFHLLLPEKEKDNATEYDAIYVYRTDSISNKVISMANSLPNNIKELNWAKKESYFVPGRYDYGIHMGLVVNNDINYTVGLNMASFTSLNLDNLLTFPYVLFYYGRIFTEDFRLNTYDKVMSSAMINLIPESKYGGYNSDNPGTRPNMIPSKMMKLPVFGGLINNINLVYGATGYGTSKISLNVSMLSEDYTEDLKNYLLENKNNGHSEIEFVEND